MLVNVKAIVAIIRSFCDVIIGTPHQPHFDSIVYVAIDLINVASKSLSLRHSMASL